MSEMFTVEQVEVLCGRYEHMSHVPSVRDLGNSYEALRAENERLAAWVGGKWNLECISCGRCPIYGTMETVGIEGKALCSNCRGMRRIREQNTRIAELEAENERLKVELGEQLSTLYKKQHEESMLAHRFFEKVLGESANGRDFSVKVLMMESRIDKLEKDQNAAIAERDTALTRIGLVLFGLGFEKTDDELVMGIESLKAERDGLRRAIEIMRSAAQSLADDYDGVQDMLDMHTLDKLDRLNGALAAVPAPTVVEREIQVDDRVTHIKTGKVALVRAICTLNDKVRYTLIFTDGLVHDGYGRSEFRADPVHAPTQMDAASDFDPTRPVASKSIP